MRAPELSHSPTFPDCLAILPFCDAALRRPREIAPSLSEALGPGSHRTLTASRALRACHHESATTATPVDVCRTWRTPGIVFAASASKLFTLPPSTGDC